MRDRPSPWLRRLLPAAVILAAAAGLSLWSQRHEAARIARIDEAVEWWCRAAAEGQDVSTEIHAEPDAVRTMIGAAFRDAFAPVRATGAGRWSVRVIAGDSPGGDGSATHHAVIAVDGTEVLGLRLVERNEFILVLGYWRPEAPGSEGS